MTNIEDRIADLELQIEMEEIEITTEKQKVQVLKKKLARILQQKLVSTSISTGEDETSKKQPQTEGIESSNTTGAIKIALGKTPEIESSETTGNNGTVYKNVGKTKISCIFKDAKSKEHCDAQSLKEQMGIPSPIEGPKIQLQTREHSKPQCLQEQMGIPSPIEGSKAQNETPPLVGVNTSAAGRKFYVIFDGPKRGFYTNWTQVELLVKGKTYKHKSYKTYTEAQKAFSDHHETKGVSSVPYKHLFDQNNLKLSPSYCQNPRAKPRLLSQLFRPPGATYVPPSDWEWQMNYSGRKVESHVNADTYTPSLDLEWQKIYSDTDIGSHVNTDTYALPDLGLPWDYSHIENVVYANVAEGKQIRHYNSNHMILLVGEGDFSFSASLAVAFGSAPNIIATSLDSEDFLKTNYMHAMSNIEKLRSRECLVMHEIDATEVANHHLLGGMTFDRIIFNFPFAGFFKKYLSREAQLIKHRRLVRLFLKNAKKMIGENGEIHISHKINGFHIEWNLESLASSHGLELIEAVEFNQSDYEGYNTKCGFGGNNNFNCDPSQTYKFGIKRVQVQLFS